MTRTIRRERIEAEIREALAFTLGAHTFVVRINRRMSPIACPSREYTYRNGRVVGLTAYRYLSDHIEITKIAVAYKPDGTVDQYMESTSTESRGQTEHVR